ncbi:hypothetical protein NDU88_007107 [Pleurodeles waltl]|uniref:Uncharacterized protein n=1 Tax=Pleurodeles waltl TaxID=8319 RepID=A0AAV7RTY3_PLEWA|nr:hypothetical protein NDU88_007107 [Pleurodeles waltl]
MKRNDIRGNHGIEKLDGRSQETLTEQEDGGWEDGEKEDREEEDRQGERERQTEEDRSTLRGRGRRSMIAEE